MARQWVRAAASLGSKPACGKFSCRYSAIASVSHTFTPLWVRHGTRKDGDSSNNSARALGSSLDRSSSRKSSPAIRHSSQPRNDQEEYFLLEIVRTALFIIGSFRCFARVDKHYFALQHSRAG